MARPGLTEIGGTWVVDGSVKPWVPSGPRIPMPPPLQPRAKFPKAQPADLRKSLAASGTPSGAPSFVIATQEQIVEQGRTLALVTVSFVPPTPTSDVIGTNIWITGYKGNANWELISTTSQSPAQFVLEQTGDTVGVFCQPFGASGASTAPFTKQAYVTLSGPGAPPAPSLSQDLTVTPTGYQFTITQESGLLTNVVAGYNVYRNSVNDAATSTKIAHLKQDPTNTGGLVFSDVQPNGVTMYYWVTAVNTWGNESTFVAAQTGAVLAVTPITSTGAINSGSTLSASGTAMSTIDESAVTGTQRNLVPDSGLKFPGTYWNLANGCSIEWHANGVLTANSIVIPGGSNFTNNCPVSFAVQPGSTITMSALMDATGVTNGYSLVGLGWSGRTTTVELELGAGQGPARYSLTVTVPSGVTAMWIYYGGYASSGTYTGTGYVTHIQVELGSVATAYRDNVLDDTTLGLNSGLQVQEPGGSLSSVVLGDAHQRAATAIDSGFIVVPSGIDFSRSYTNKFGTYLPRASGDATTLDRAFAKAAAGDADTLLSIPDDASYAKTRASGLQSGVVKPGWWNAIRNLTADTTNGARFYPVVRPNPYVAANASATASYFGTSCEVSFQFAFSATTGTNILDVFHADANGNGYLFEIGNASGSTEPTIWTWNGTGFTTIATASTQAPGADLNTHSCRIQTFSNGQMDVYIDGVLALRTTDTTYAPDKEWAFSYYSNVVYISDVVINGHAMLAGVASDNSGVTLGYSGAVGLVVGNGFISPSTGGYLPRRTVWSGPTGTEANGTVISFSALADQAGNPLPAFDTAPLVSLAPYNMSTAPALLYASGVTKTGFTLNSYSAATASEGSTVNLPNGTAESVPATAGTTITGVVFTATVTAKTITPEQNFSQVITVYVGGIAVGTITINGKTGGGTYHGSATDAVSGNPTSVTAKASWSLSSDVSSVTVSVTPQQISGETAMSANVTCAITEQYNS